MKSLRGVPARNRKPFNRFINGFPSRRPISASLDPEKFEYLRWDKMTHKARVQKAGEKFITEWDELHDFWENADDSHEIRIAMMLWGVGIIDAHLRRLRLDERRFHEPSNQSEALPTDVRRLTDALRDGLRDLQLGSHPPNYLTPINHGRGGRRVLDSKARLVRHVVAAAFLELRAAGMTIPEASHLVARKFSPLKIERLFPQLKHGFKATTVSSWAKAERHSYDQATLEGYAEMSPESAMGFAMGTLRQSYELAQEAVSEWVNLYGR